MNFDGVPLIGKPTSQKQVEVCRSFSYKLNLANHGGPAYESADFFCSRKISCNEEDAAAVSEAIFEECVSEIRAAVQGVVAGLVRRKDQRRAS